MCGVQLGVAQIPQRLTSKTCQINEQLIPLLNFLVTFSKIVLAVYKFLANRSQSGRVNKQTEENNSRHILI